MANAGNLLSIYQNILTGGVGVGCRQQLELHIGIRLKKTTSPPDQQEYNFSIDRMILDKFQTRCGPILARDLA